MSRNLLRKPDVLKKLPLGKSKLYELISERRFPAPIKIGRASLWDEAAVDAAIERLIAEHQQKPAA